MLVFRVCFLEGFWRSPPFLVLSLSKALPPPPHPEKLRWQMEHPPFEDVFTIENGEFSTVVLVFRCVGVVETLVSSWQVTDLAHCSLRVTPWCTRQEETRGHQKNTVIRRFYTLQPVSHRYLWLIKSTYLPWLASPRNKALLRETNG